MKSGEKRKAKSFADALAFLFKRSKESTLQEIAKVEEEYKRGLIDWETLQRAKEYYKPWLEAAENGLKDINGGNL